MELIDGTNDCMERESHESEEKGKRDAPACGSGIGGYVLTAVIAFTAGVVATAILMRYGKRRTAGKDAAADEEKEEKT
jgi:hypothetical protein